MCEHCNESKKPKKYLIEYEELMKEYDWEANEGLDPSKLTYGSRQKIWWICEHGHKWIATINNRTCGHTGCPYCSNNKILPGYNDFATICPELVKEWHIDNKIKPTEVSAYSNRIIKWQCSKNSDHIWESEISIRAHGSTCPYCKLKYLDDYPKLMKEYDWEANGGIDFSRIHGARKKKIWWKCENGHKWQQSFYDRARGRNCPYCSGRKVLSGYNDLATLRPDLLAEWNYKKNTILPSEVTVGSYKKVWWKCKYGHEWETPICNRGSQGYGCPYCSRRTSFPEYVIKYYLEKLGLEVKHSYKGFNFELDLYIPELNIGIEYDGYYWHKDKDKRKKDKEKNKKCKELGITLYRVREGISSLKDTSIDICSKKRGLNERSIKRLVNKICPNNNISINLKKETNLIHNLEKYFISKKEIIINNEIKSYKHWSLYFGKASSYVSSLISKHGLEYAKEKLTKMYWEKQKQESIQKDNIAA